MFTALAAGSAFAQEENYTIGISQFAEHGSLDNCREGFLEGLKEAGIEEGVNLEVTYQNAQADTGTASQISDSFCFQRSGSDLCYCTPSAMSRTTALWQIKLP